MPLNRASPFRQPQNLAVAEHERPALLFGCVDRARRTASSSRVNYLALFIAKRFLQNRPSLFLPQQWLENHVLVRVYHALYHHFTQAPRCTDPDHIWKTALGVDRKHDAGLVGPHHFLHPGRERDFAMIELFLLAIADCAIGEE